MKGAEIWQSEHKWQLTPKPEFNKWEILGAFALALDQIVHHVQRSQNLDLLTDPIERYVEIGELGDLLLLMLNGINSSSEGSELW